MKSTFLKMMACLLVISFFTVSARADVVNPFYSIGQFNTVLFGNLTANSSDNEGYMAVGGDINVSGGYGFASRGGQRGDMALVVGGQLNMGSGQLYGGDAYIGVAGGSENKLTMSNGNKYVGTCPVDFSALQNELRGTSAALVDLGTAATPVSNTWNAQFNVTAGTLNILNISAADLKNGNLTSMQLNGMTSDTQVIINIIGDANNRTLSMNGGEIQGAGNWGNNVMLNLVDIDTFTIANHGRNNFSILAVDTHLNLTNMSTEGLVVAKSATMTNAEFHTTYPFKPEIDLPTDDPTPPAATPEPGTALMFFLGMVGFPIYRRFRIRQAA